MGVLPRAPDFFSLIFPGPLSMAALCHFIDGYSLCMSDLVAFLDSTSGLADVSLWPRVRDHLQHRLQGWRLARAPPALSEASAGPPMPSCPPLFASKSANACPARPLPLVQCAASCAPCGNSDSPENSPPEGKGAPWRPW